MGRRLILLAIALMGAVLAGCAVIPPDDPFYRAFSEVSARIEPVARQECLLANPARRCDFVIQIDLDPEAPANAFQSLGRDGRPVVIFTAQMLHSFSNRDEMAFVLGHETAHHVLGHLDRQRLNAAQGAVLLGELVTLEGGSAEEIANAQYLGAVVGARSYSKEFELEADAMGTLIAARAGYSPNLGIAYFQRIPDPGDQFLGTHPSTRERIQTVRRTIRDYGLN